MTAAAAAQLLGRPGPGQSAAGILASSAAMRPGRSMRANMEYSAEGGQERQCQARRRTSVVRGRVAI